LATTACANALVAARPKAPNPQLHLTRTADTVYVAILLGGEKTPKSEAVIKALAEQGWQKVDEAFTTTFPLKADDKGWVLYKHPINKGVVDLADPGGGMRIIVFK